MIRALALALLLATSGCGRHDGAAPAAAAGPFTPAGLSRTVVSSSAWSTLRTRIEQTLASSPGCSASGTTCDTTTVAWRPSGAHPTAHDPVVLILDTGDSLAAGTRDGSRVLGRFQVDTAGRLVTAHPTYTVAKGAADVLRSLDVPDAIVPHALTADLSQSFDQAYETAAWGPYVTSHMNWVYDILASYAPHAYFVLVDSRTEDEAGRDDLCDLSPAARERIRRRYAALAASLHQLIDMYGVDYVNFSGGYSRDQLAGRGWFGCPSTPPTAAVDDFLAITANYVRDLAGHPGVTLVEAGVSSTGRLAVGDPAAPGDCAELPGRIRVGYYLRKDSGLAPGGLPADGTLATPLPTLLPPDQRGAAACVDLYVNLGFELNDAYDGEPGPAPLRIGLDGLGFGFKPFVPPATSWAAPLALAHLIHLQDQAFAGGEDRLPAAALLDRARGGHATVKAIDPLRNGQFTTFNPD